MKKPVLQSSSAFNDVSRRRNAKRTCQQRTRCTYLCICFYLMALFGFWKRPGGSLDLIEQQQQQHDEDPRGTPLDTSVLSSDHFASLVMDLARAFPDRSDASWCSHPSDPGNEVLGENSELAMASPTGLIFLQMPEATSSAVLLGVNQRIAKHYNCSFHDGPRQPVKKYYSNRDREHSFLWTFVSDPAVRAFHQAHFHFVALENKPTDDRAFLDQYLQWDGPADGAVLPAQVGFQIDYASMPRAPPVFWSDKSPRKVMLPKIVRKRVRGVINDYDFLASTERMDESLVALKMLLGVDMQHIVSLSAQVGDRKYHLHENKCVPYSKTDPSPAVLEHFQSPEWIAKNYGDYLLRAAVNACLDKTIERLGKQRFATELSNFRRLAQKVETECREKAASPCSFADIDQEHSLHSCIAEQAKAV